MMKLILFITALLALVSSNNALQCYVCRTPDLVSSYIGFRTLPFCDNNMENYKMNISQLHFPVCKKIHEKIQGSGKQEILIIRTYENNQEPFNLSKDIFEEYDCRTDLCNTGIHSTPAWLTLLLSILIFISINI